MLDLPESHPSARLRVRVLHADRGTAVVDTSTPVRRDGADRVAVHFDRLDLAPGTYRVEVDLFSDDWASRIDEHEAATLVVRGDGPDTAALAPPHEWRHG